MPKFAIYDPAAPQPTPVLGWRDTDKRKYKTTPPDSHLLALTDEQWAERLSTPFVHEGRLVADPGPSVAAQAAFDAAVLQSQARKVLRNTNEAVLAFLEHGEAVPVAWANYRNALRSIAKGLSPDATALPDAPAA